MMNRPIRIPNAPYAIDARTHPHTPSMRASIANRHSQTRYLTTLSHDFGAFALAFGAVSSPVTRRIWFLMTVS